MCVTEVPLGWVSDYHLAYPENSVFTSILFEKHTINIPKIIMDECLSCLLIEFHILDKRVHLNWPRQQKVVTGESLSTNNLF